MDFKKEIGRRIAAERNRCGYSLEELSHRTQGILSKSRISNYEQGTRMPGPQEAIALATALGCDAAYLMCLQSTFTRQELELVRDFRALPERDRNDYFRRISVLALAHKEPVADERLLLSYYPETKPEKESGSASKRPKSRN